MAQAPAADPDQASTSAAQAVSRHDTVACAAQAGAGRAGDSGYTDRAMATPAPITRSAEPETASA